ncbi:tumor necrosis factor ligand superfamily member 14-like [Mugil cephalus]|uniref:tumor necrosis factor ligand superfamily member 14-like n=1 Tax=Mugil cephalus TaxID=48193 RepID=UPI001FB78A3E|nr:tumor necrosis factor ligand superfamily member 14-like [Mugil cephalus]XP_047434743.1 tumor necrosis factor ligand superfamily member 14-like [Mugil cephalus]XP_047434744.1 tumor necrosis factor ligand superfamily member 14-like [Mugil cephalus]
MAEAGVGTCPQVFVVDSQANYLSVPSKPKQRWERLGHRVLPLLVALAMLALIVQGFLIYHLYQKTEAFSRSHPLCQNLSNPQTGQQGGTIMGQVGSKESNEIPTMSTQTHQRPFAHLIASSSPVGEDSVVQWAEQGEAVTQNMRHEKGWLIAETEGYYYIYSKLQLNNADCLFFQHKVMKSTSAYAKPIELMKSKSSHCLTPKPTAKTGDIWNSFLAGIFHLQRGDKIFVTLENKQKAHIVGFTENFMGAFMIFP